MQQVSVDRARAGTGGSWWRWPLLPFAAITASFLTAGMLVLCQHVVVGLLFGNDNVYLLYSVPLQASLIGGFAFSWAACAVAPSGKQIAGTALVTLLGVFAAFGVAAAYSGQIERPVASAIQYIACLGAAVCGLATYREDRLCRLMTAVNSLLEASPEGTASPIQGRE